jgi:WD40 repeat protein/serine/threonine protein kinase/DNA-binding LacI/PurR family transcriptional regulator
MSNLVNQEIKGYQMQEVLGEGGFGAVYRAFQPLVKREVAIKVILPEFANQPDFVRRFEAEAQLVARLEHLHIVPLYDYWRDPSGAFLVMRMLRGGSLEELIEKEGPWELNSAVRLLEQVASALAIAHGNGVIHRDLKPANILLDNERNAYLSDFGIAKDVGESGPGDAGTMVGTPAYVAPEQIQGQKVSPQTDIYCLGLVMYEVLTGKAAFVGSNASSLILKQMTENVQDLAVLRPDLPSALNMVIQIATAKDPNNRFPNVATFASALRQAVEGKKDSRQVPAMGKSGESDGLLVFPSDFQPFILSPEMLDLEAPEIQLVNPYKGLRAFQETDADDFFGRKTLIEKLLDRLKEAVRGQRFLAVVGPSGSGKSSVVKAGLIPSLRKGALDNSENYFIAEMVPSTDALRELEAAILSIAINPASDITETLRASTDGLHRIIHQILPNDGSEFLLLIDQFEEVFTQTEDNAVRVHFMDMLQYALLAPDSRFRAIITIRADFFDKPLMYAEFGGLVRERFEVVLPLNREELEETIVGPAMKAGAKVEPELVERIVDEVVVEPGALPLLQYAMTELFERRTGITLTLESYKETGGVLASLAKRAEEIYLEMDDEHQEAIRQLFLRLVTLGEGTEDTRRRILWSELVFKKEHDDPLQKVLDQYGRFRLLTFDKDPNTREPTVEVAHEALIRQWKRLRDWLRNSREDLRAQRRLSSAVADWRNSGGENSFLATGTRLQQFELLLASTNIQLTKDERDYIQASMERRESEARDEALRLEKERQSELRQKRLARMAAVIFGIGFVVAAGLGIYAFFLRADAIEARDDANTQADIARQQAQANFSLSLAQQARQFPRTGRNPFQAIGFVADAINVRSVTTPPAEVQRVFADTLFSPGALRQYIDSTNKGLSGYFWNADFTADGSQVVAGSNDSQAYLWDVETGDLIRTFQNHDSWVFNVDISPDDRYLAASYQIGGPNSEIVVLYDLTTGEKVRDLVRVGGGSHTDAVLSVQFSADGNLLFTGSNDANPNINLIAWDVETGEEAFRMVGHDAAINDLALSPDGSLLASASGDGKVILWDTATGNLVHTFGAHESGATSAAFSPDGLTLATGGANAQVILWSLDDYSPGMTFDIPGVEVRGMSYNNAGLIALGGWLSAKIVVLDTNTGSTWVEFQGTPSISTSTLFAPDGRRIISTDQTVVLWDVYGEGDIVRRFDPSQSHVDRIYSIALSPNGVQAVTGSRDGSIIQWDIQTGQALQVLEGHSQDENVIHALAYSPDGNRIFAATQAGDILEWNPEGVLQDPLEAHAAPVRTLAISPDGTRLASGGGNILLGESRPEDNVIRIWDLATNQVVSELAGHSAPVNALAFSPNGTRLLSGADDNTLILWDVTTASAVQTFTGHSAAILSVAFSPDGLFAASGSEDESVRYWDLTTLQQVNILEGHGSPVRKVAFLPDGAFLLSSSGDLTPNSDNSLILWDLRLEDPEIRRLRGHSGAVRDFALSQDGTLVLSVGDDEQPILWRLFNLESLVDWMYTNQDVVCTTPNANYPAPDPRCVTYTAEASTPAPEGEDEATPEVVTAAAPSGLCSVASTNVIPTGSADTSAYAKDGPYVIGFSNAGMVGTSDALIGSWVQYQADQNAEQIESLLVKDAGGNAEQQVADIQDLLTQEVDALIINPVDQRAPDALEAIMQTALSQNIPVVVINRHTPNSEAYVSFIGPDDFEVACAMTQEIIALLDGEGTWVQLNGVDGSIVDIPRRDGASAIFNLYPGMQTIEQSATNLDETTTRDFMGGLMGRGQIDSLWAFNGYIAAIAQDVLVQNGLEPVPAVGDAYVGLTQFALENGLPLAQVRIPSTMGADAVTTVLQILAGQPVEQFQRLELSLITNANVNEYDLTIPANGYLGDYDGLPREYWPQ